MTALDARPEVGDTQMWRELAPMDRAWCGVWYIRAFLELDLPSPERFRRAVRDLAVETPAFGHWRTVTPPRWRPVADHERGDWLDRVVVVSDEADVDDERAFELNFEPLDDVPFRFVVGPNWVSVRMSHAVGDGYTVNAVVGHLLRRASSDEAMTAPRSYLEPRRRDRMIVRDVATHPRTLVSALRHRRELAGGRYEPSTTRADAMPALSVLLLSAVGFPATLRAIRAESYQDASAAAVAMVGLRAAFAQCLPEPRAGFECLFNTRTARTATCWGNWSVGVYIHPADDYSPDATSREMVRVRNSGLPQLAAASLRARAKHADGATVQVVAPEGAPRLTLSYTQQHAMDVIPGLRAGRSAVATWTTPNGVETITVQAVELAGRLSVGLSFYPDVWSREQVERAVRLFLDDPRAVLGRARPTGSP